MSTPIQIPTLIHPADVQIVRNEGRHPGRAALYDADGDFRGSFPAAMPDHFILEAIAFGNVCYRTGLEHGAANKMSQIRGVLGIPNVSDLESRVERLEETTHRH